MENCYIYLMYDMITKVGCGFSNGKKPTVAMLMQLESNPVSSKSAEIHFKSQNNMVRRRIVSYCCAETSLSLGSMYHFQMP